MGLREEKKQELRRQILSTALHLYGEHGLGATRVADIASRLRISEATFFNYFPTKQAVCEEAVAETIAHAIEQTMTPEGVLDEQLHALVDALVSELTPQRPLVSLLRRNPEIMAAGWLRVRRPGELMTERIEKAQADGLVRADPPGEVLGEMLLDAMAMTLTRALARHDSVEAIATSLGHVVDVWSDGCAPRTRPAQSPGRATV